MKHHHSTALFPPSATKLGCFTTSLSRCLSNQGCVGIFQLTVPWKAILDPWVKDQIYSGCIILVQSLSVAMDKQHRWGHLEVTGVAFISCSLWQWPQFLRFEISPFADS